MVQKSPININFAKGLNLKLDPYQVPVGNFLTLVNTVFDKVGRLTKRNGFPELTPLPNDTTSYLTTFNGDLQAVGDNILAYSLGQEAWINKGSIYPIELSTLPLIRNSVNQSQADIAISSNGLVCTVYTENDASGTIFKYAIADATTGQNIVEPTALPSANTTYGTPRVYVVGNYFIILYTNTSSALIYLAISWVNPTASTMTAVVASTYVPATTVAFDAILLNSSLYIAYQGTSQIKAVSLSPTLALSNTFTIDASHGGTLFSMATDLPNQVLWVTYWASGDAYTTAVTPAFIQRLAPTHLSTPGTVLNIASTAQNDVLSFWFEINNNYGYDASIPTHYIAGNTITLAGVAGTLTIKVRSVGLASKAFVVDGVSYFLSAYQSPYQPSYFLIDATASTAANPIVVAKVAYSNGGGYLTTGLPNVVLYDGNYYTPYLYKDLLQAVNKNTNVPAGNQIAGVYTQTGINMVNFDFTTDGLLSVETGSDLHLTGGFLWMYDGYLPVEHNFFLWPDSVEAAWSTTGGSIAAQPDGSTNTNAYYYQVVYQWADNQGNGFTSAPSIPVAVTTTGSGSTGSITLNIPTLRLTYKIANPLKICIYRWSVEQEVYYQVTELTFTTQNPLTLNNTTIDYVTFVDTLSDAQILGNNIIYTTGGVVEDVNAPSSTIMTLFDDRLWLVDAEDPNLLWFSKQVIETTPVEMSDLFTFYVAPSIGAQGSTGNITALCPMDDKLVIFKPNAIYYINGTGPDNTGANNYYSQPIFITSSVGCANQRSAIVTPSGIMFQSDKGIWLLGRDLSTTYIGAPVEDFNVYAVTSSQVIPNTNQVRFGLSNGSMLMYDYFVGQWGEFQGIPSLSSTLYQGYHTLVNEYGDVSQETPDTYLDGSNPVLMSFTTSWLQLAGLRGYQRAYWFYLLGTYLSPHKLQVEVAYDYNQNPVQSSLITPNNFSLPWGSDPYYGGDGSTSFGGGTSIEQERVFFTQERCRAFQLSITEVFDPSFGTIAGAGLTLSGLNIIAGFKKAYAPIPQNQQTG
jgi:hypothetical protein